MSGALSHSGTDFATGSSDHSVRVWEISTCGCVRGLFKEGGHREWVVTLDYLNDDRIVSDSMDNQILIWRRGSAKSFQLGLHESFEKMVSIGDSVVSVGYDGQVRVFSNVCEVTELPIDRQLSQLIGFPKNGLAVGSRQGSVALVESGG